MQTAMTQQIANLESELGVRLFERRHRALELTAAGERFLQDAKEIVVQAGSAAERARSVEAGCDALLRIGYHGEMFQQDLIRLLRSMRADGARSKVTLCQRPQTELLEGVRDGELDFAFTLYGAFFETEDWLAWSVLEEDYVMLVVADDHPLAGRKQVSMAEVERLPLILFDEKNREERDIRLARTGRRLKEYCRVWDHTSGEILVRSGYGAAIWLSRLCRSEIYPDLAFIPITDHPGREKVVLIWKKDSLNSEKEAFRARVLAQLQRGNREKEDC